MKNELLLGSRVTFCPTGQAGYVTGFYVLSPGAEVYVGENDRQLTGGSPAAEWLQETSFCLARAARGFARVTRALDDQPVYWRLSSLTYPNDMDDEEI
jgi:hypothetical protein